MCDVKGQRAVHSCHDSRADGLGTSDGPVRASYRGGGGDQIRPGRVAQVEVRAGACEQARGRRYERGAYDSLLAVLGAVRDGPDVGWLRSLYLWNRAPSLPGCFLRSLEVYEELTPISRNVWIPTSGRSVAPGDACGSSAWQQGCGPGD